MLKTRAGTLKKNKECLQAEVDEAHPPSLNPPSV